MKQKITCPHCKKEFDMAEGLTSHFKSLEETHIQNINKQEEAKRKKDEEKYQNIEKENLKYKEKVQKFNDEKEAEIKKAREAERAENDKKNKDHWESVLETKMEKHKEDTDLKQNEERQKWKLEKDRYIKQIATLNQDVNQGSTVDQGSASEVSLGEFLKKIFKDKKDKIEEYEKGEAGGDWIQEIIEQDLSIGKILYERKTTKAWSNKWIGKLQGDMEASSSDYGIIFTRTTPKEFPKDAKFIHKGNIFICKYDYDALSNLSQTQRHLMIQLNKERKTSTENELSALKFWENPKVKNAMFKAIEDRSDTRKQIRLAKKNMDNAEKIIDTMGTNLDKIFFEIDNIGLSAFLDKKKETDEKE